MEDIVQILFIMIFIGASILSSIKKKKQQQPKGSLPNSNANQQVMEKVKQKSSSDILEQMLGLKIELPEPPKNEAPVIYSENTNYEDTSWDPEKDYETINQDGVSDYHEKIAAKKNEFSIDKSKYQAFKEENIIAKPEQIKKPTLIEKLFAVQNNHSVLKEYIIIQEILNKPKSLRR